MIKAIIWDYDETLVDTRLKNLHVTRLVMDEVIGPKSRELWGLKSLDNYVEVHNRSKNWMELYHQEFGLTHDQVDFAGTLWSKYQLQDSTPVNFFDGIEATLHHLARFPHGIVSQNSHENITKHLSKNGVGKYFKHIVGYEEVPRSKQKPHPEGLLRCMSEISDYDENSDIVYLGDHETDSQSVHLANDLLGRQAIFNIGVCFSKPDMTKTWEFKPDFVVHKPQNIPSIIKSLR